MAGPIRISILANAAQATANIRAVDNGVGRLSARFSKLKGPLIAAGIGAVAVGGGLLKLAKGAAEDEKAQTVLAKTLKNTAHATDAQVKSVEAYIAKTGVATGVTDDEMRPALANLVRATHDVGKAQGLMNLAMDVSAGTGKDLGAVSLALAKAQNGNVGALGRLGIKTKDASGKTLTFAQITKNLATTFRGQAAASAGTLEGKWARLKLIAQETGESIGAKLLPVLSTFATFLLTKVGPALSRAGRFFTANILPQLQRFGSFLQANVIPALSRFAGFFGAEVLPRLKAFGEFLAVRIIPIVRTFITGALAGLSNSFERIRQTIADNRPQLEAFGSAIRTAADFILRKLVPVVSFLARGGFTSLGIAIGIVIKVIATFVKVVQGIITATKAIVAAISSVIGFFKRLPGDIQRAVGDTAKALYAKGRGFLVGLLRGATSFLGSVARLFTSLRTTVTRWVGDTARTLYQRGRGFLAGLARGVASFLSSVARPFTGLRSSVSRWVGDTASTLYAKGRGFLIGLARGIASFLGSVAGYFTRLPGQVGRWIGNTAGVLYSAGRNLIQGLIDGIRSKISDAISAVSGLAQAIKDHLPGSPIKRGPLRAWNNGRPGKLLITRLIEGIRSQEPELRRTMGRISQTIDGSLSARPAVALGVGTGSLLAGSGAAAPIVINVSVLTGGPEAGRAVVGAIKKYEQINGTRWRTM